MVANATPGAYSKDALVRVGAGALLGKPPIVLANAVTPAFELVYPYSSLGEEPRRVLPDIRVVKTLSTFGAQIMIEPSAIEPSGVFVSGDGAGAKAAVSGLLRDLGRPEDSILDLGAISSAKGLKHYFLMFAFLRQAPGTPAFNARVVR